MNNNIVFRIKKHHFRIKNKKQFGTEALKEACQYFKYDGTNNGKGLDKESEYEADIDGMVISANSGYDASSFECVRKTSLEGLSFIMTNIKYHLISHYRNF